MGMDLLWRGNSVLNCLGMDFNSILNSKQTLVSQLFRQFVCFSEIFLTVHFQDGLYCLSQSVFLFFFVLWGYSFPLKWWNIFLWNVLIPLCFWEHEAIFALFCFQVLPVNFLCTLHRTIGTHCELVFIQVSVSEFFITSHNSIFECREVIVNSNRILLYHSLCTEWFSLFFLEFAIVLLSQLGLLRICIKIKRRVDMLLTKLVY